MVLSQFTATVGKQCLKDFFSVEKDIYPVGRLDYDSEGLLILTNDMRLNHQLLNPLFKHEREYLVQVDGAVTDEALHRLRGGVTIGLNGEKYKTLPALAGLLEDTSWLPERDPPIRYRKNIPTSWISLVLKEGKNRQVRKMTASVGFPTLRLIRNRIERIGLNNMQPGDIVEWSQTSIYGKLFGK